VTLVGGGGGSRFDEAGVNHAVDDLALMTAPCPTAGGDTGDRGEIEGLFPQVVGCGGGGKGPPYFNGWGNLGSRGVTGGGAVLCQARLFRPGAFWRLLEHSGKSQPRRWAAMSCSRRQDDSGVVISFTR